MNRVAGSVVALALGLATGCGGEAPADAPAAPSADLTPLSPAEEQFLGAWSLTRRERRDAGGELIGEPITDHTGYIIYDRSGYMGVTLMLPDRTPYVDEEPTADEALGLWGTYASYFGRFSVDEAAGIVTHHLEGSVNPSGAGSDYQRHYSFTDTALILRPPPSDDGSQAMLTWERLPDLPESELTDTHPELFGTYRVESVTRHTTDGFEVAAEQYDVAYIFYVSSGHMSVHLARPGRLPFADRQPTATEALMATDTYGSYFGPFSVNEIVGCITCPGPRDEGYLVHHRIGSENPSGSGTDARRYFELDDTALTLRPPVSTDDEGRNVVSAIRWLRVPPRP